MATKKRIMFAGATGYGNLGDDCYKDIFAKYLCKDYDLIFDSPYPDIRYMDKVDYLVIGGGGLIYDNESDHFNYMKKYMDAAIERNIPLFFISCGVQIFRNSFKADLENKNIKGLADTINNWKPYLEKAVLITVRSEMDAQVIKELSDKVCPIILPDMCYMVEPSKHQIVDNIKTVIIPNKQLFGFEDYIERVKEHLNENTFMLAMSSEDNYIIEQIGLRLGMKSMLNDRRMVTVGEAARMIKDADKVITSRYHGIVFARAMGKKEEDIEIWMDNFKGLTEMKPYCMLASEGHIEYLKDRMSELEEKYD